MEKIIAKIKAQIAATTADIDTATFTATNRLF